MADITSDIVKAHGQVKSDSTTQSSVTEALLNEESDELVPGCAQERVPHIVLIVVRAL